MRPEASKTIESPSSIASREWAFPCHATCDSNSPIRFTTTFPGSFLRWKALDDIVREQPADFHLAPSNVLGGRSLPIGFDEDPDLLYFASDRETDRFGLYGLRLSTGQRTDLAIEHPFFDLIPPSLHDFRANRNLVFDRYSRRFLGIRYFGSHETTAWVEADWRALQARLESTFPAQNVEIIEWDRNRQRFLVKVDGPTDPGAFHLFDLAENRSLEIARQAPNLDEAVRVTQIPFGFTGDDGTLIHGRMLLPAEPVAKPIRSLCIARTLPGRGSHPTSTATPLRSHGWATWFSSSTPRCMGVRANATRVGPPRI